MKPTKSYPYSVVNVFTTVPLSGNSLAVFPDASEFDTETMQRIARELKLTETAFVLPATHKDCAARVRIFSPARELPFAGHPTVGTGFVLMQKEIVPRNSTAFVLQEQIGPVQLRIEAGPRPLICLRMPPVREGRCYDPSLCAQVLGLEEEVLLPIKPQLLNAGNPTVFVAARDKAVVDRAWLDLAGFRALKGEESESFCVFCLRRRPKAPIHECLLLNMGSPKSQRQAVRPGPSQFT
jgi:trans-2,3-dihydro-3-hydroxyanthranilate isomerase